MVSKKFRQNPKFSIIIPSYNQGQFIERTILSIINQNYPNYEIIIMDGGSKDETIDLLKKYSQKYPRKLIWKSKKDNGQSHAINKGMRLAKGDILAYLNSDDTYEPGTFRKIADFFKINKSFDFVYGRVKFIDENDNYLYEYPIDEAKLLSDGCPIGQPGAFWTRKLFEKVGLFSEKLNYSMDYDYWLRASKYFTLTKTDDFFANYRLHTASKTVSQSTKMMREALEIMQNHYGVVSFWFLRNYANDILHEKFTFNPKSKLHTIIRFTLQSILTFLLMFRYPTRLDSTIPSKFILFFKRLFV